jgi:hypothetical protein
MRIRATAAWPIVPSQVSLNPVRSRHHVKSCNCELQPHVLRTSRFRVYCLISINTSDILSRARFLSHFTPLFVAATQDNG